MLWLERAYSDERVHSPTRPRFPCSLITWFVIEGSTREPDGCGWGVNCNHRPLTEYDPEKDDVLFFGYVAGWAQELGYFTLSELTAIRGMLKLPVERDQHFRPARLSEVKAELRRWSEE